MKRIAICAILATLFIAPVVYASEDTAWTPQQKQVLEAIGRLSASTAPDGGGADAYAAVLSDDFSRWTVGSTITNGKKAWVDGMRDWWKDGWRVTGRETQFLEISVRGDFAFTRRIVKETYAAPNEQVSVSTAAVTEVWTLSKAGWLLLTANVHPMDEP